MISQTVADDKHWESLKGNITNSALTKEEVIENYKHFWTMEKAFRISKNETRIRPVSYYKNQRIQAHICLSFVAHKVYKELERQLKQKEAKSSIDKAIEIAKTILPLKPLSQTLKNFLERFYCLMKNNEIFTTILPLIISVLVRKIGDQLVTFLL